MGHLNASFGDPVFRILLLRGMAWAEEEDFGRFRRVVLDSANYVDDVTAISSGEPAPGSPHLWRWEDIPGFEWKGRTRDPEGRACLVCGPR